MKFEDLTIAELRQLEWYIEGSKFEGVYYKPKDQFEKRQEHLLEIIRTVLRNKINKQGIQRLERVVSGY
jgi:hypothetical protein